MPNFNEAQQAAIFAENHSILASAGAGAGKTSVMTERVGQQILYHGKKVDQMLVVTFTKEAAFSMREKIRGYLRKKIDDKDTPDDVHDAAQEALAKMSACHISTIHSFCKYVLQMGYMLVNIDPQFDIADSVISQTYFEQAVKQAIENIASSSYPAEKKKLFGYLKRAVNVDTLTETCHTLHNELMGVPNPYDRLHDLIDVIDLPAEKNPWAQTIINYNRQKLNSILLYIPELEELKNDPQFPVKNLPAIEADIVLLKDLADFVRENVSIPDLIDKIRMVMVASPDMRKYSTRGLSEEEKATYSIYKAIHSKLTGSSCDLQKIIDDLITVSEPQSIRDNQHIKKQLLGLEVLIREVGKCFTEIKVENNQLDFSDLEQYAYQILTNKDQPDVRDAICNQFTDVFVDECQDVSGIQYAIIMALQTPTTSTFFVGDIKQSIYRFRHADPLLFLHMRDTFSEDKDAEERKIYFQHNYRSSANIIDSVNAVFDSCMSRDLTEIEYEKGDFLLVGRDDIPCANTEVVVIKNKYAKGEDLQPDETKDPIEAECTELASKIQELINEGYQYKDIVILLRATTKATEMVDWLTKLHIPAYFEGKQSFFGMPEVAMFLEILKCIDNDHQDIPLLTVLKNAPFFFTDLDLATIRTEYGKPKSPFYTCFYACAEANNTDLEKRCHNANETIHEWRTKAQITRTSDLIWMLLKEYGIYAVQGAMPGGEMRCKNLYALHQRAVALESTGHYRLSEFLNHIRDLTKLGASGSEVPAPLGENDNFVRIMTIHASKGLEFPVVFILEMHRNIHRTEKKDSLHMDIETSNGRTALGLYMPYINKGRHISRSTYGINAFNYKKYLNELAEETRMLYVAMTRAQERLIMIGQGNPGQAAQWNSINKEARIIDTSTMFDMVMPVALGGESLPDLDEERYFPLWTIKYTRPKAANISDEAEEAARSLPDGLKSDIDFHDEWRKTADNILLPAKAAVTSVVAGKFEELGEDDELPDTQDDVQIVSFRLPEEAEKPLFLHPVEAKTAANLGTLFHHFMELMNFEAFQGLSDSEYAVELEKQLTALRAKDVMNTDETNEIRNGLDGIVAFLHTEIGQKFISGSVRIFREQELTVEIVSHGQKILVQGVIDIMYMTEEGHWVILDYKTDHDFRPEALIEKHKAQLNWYRLAVETITETPVDSLWLISLRTGQSHQVPMETPTGFII